MEYISPTQMSFGEIFGKAVDMYAKNFREIVLITLLVYVPIGIVMYFVGQQLLSSDDVSMKDCANYIRVAGRLENIVGTFATVFVIFLVKHSLEQKVIPFQETLKLAFSNWGSVIAGNILYSIGVGLSFLLFIVPGIMFGVYWYFFIYLIVLKGVSRKESFKESKKLVKGRWWEIFGYCLFSFFGVLIFSYLTGQMPYIETFYMDLFTTLLIELVALFMVVFMTLKFIDIDKQNLPPTIQEETIPKTESEPII